MVSDIAACFALSRRGTDLHPNEDRFVVHRLIDGSLLVGVADGLGGNVAGARAAQVVAERLSGTDAMAETLETVEMTRIVHSLDKEIAHMAATDPSLANTGSTLVAVLVRQRTAHWVNVGDSRLYLFRDRILTQVTQDHTLARWLLSEGEITARQARTHYSREVLEQWLGCGEIMPETGCLALQNDDLLLLCSDGLHRYLPTDLITSVLSGDLAIDLKARSLVQAVLDRGGSDDITVLLLRYNTI
jgi:protein phosphatase